MKASQRIPDPTCPTDRAPIMSIPPLITCSLILGAFVQSATCATDACAKPPAFTPLPLGEVKPAGWLRDWCQDAADGITGHSDELSPLFEKGWMSDAKVNIDKERMQAGDKPKGYMLEQSAYWLDGAVRLARLLGDEKLLAKCRLRFEAVLERVEAGRPPMNVNQDLWSKGEKWAHWPMAIMGRALVAEFSATRDPRYLHALESIYAGYSKFSPDGKTFSLIRHGGRQITNTEVMFEAFRLGGGVQLRDEAVAVLRSESDEIGERLAWHEEGLANGKINKQFLGVQHGHAVTFNESAKLPAIGFLYTGEPTWLRFSEASFADMEKNEMLPYGLTSGQEQPCGVGPFSLTELCNAVDYSWSNIWLLRITGKSSYADRIERTMFNAAPGGISPDFKQHVYYLSPNRIDQKHPDRSPTGAGSSAQFAPKHNPLCCTGNISRLLPNYVMHMWMASGDGGLAATLYGPSDTTTKVGNVGVKLKTTTDYPFGDEVTVKVSPDRALAFPLHLRVPSWSAKTSLSINDQPQPATVDQGFVHLQRKWKPGDVVSLTFSRKPRILTGICANGSPYASVTCGPLLFALPIPTVAGDLNEAQPGAPSQFALLPGTPVEIVRNPMPARWSWNTSPPPLELKTSALPVVADADFSLPRSSVTADAGSLEKIMLVPFGSTAFRTSMFGVAAPR